jgi:Fe-S-cluster containining protein
MVSRYRELAGKVDAFFARVVNRHGDAMQCGSGCSDCCHVRLSVTTVEADAIREELGTWHPERRAQLAENLREARTDRCAALDPGGRCLVYSVRPIVCRSHGAPVRMTKRSLPVIEVCHRNFAGVEPEPDCVIDQTTLSTLVLAVNGGDDRRIDLAELLASC